MSDDTEHTGDPDPATVNCDQDWEENSIVDHLESQFPDVSDDRLPEVFEQVCRETKQRERGDFLEEMRRRLLSGNRDASGDTSEDEQDSEGPSTRSMARRVAERYTEEEDS